MADINSITTGASYRGDPALGGAGAVGVTIDPSPLARLATFTYYRDRDLWEKKQKDDAIAAEKIAMMTAFDINSPLKPYTDDLKKGLDEYQTYVRDNPDSLVYSRSPEKFQKREEILGRLVNKRKRATVNDVLYNRDKAAAELEPNAAKRQAKLELLDINANDLFVNGVEDAYNKQYRSAAEIKPDDYNVGKIPTTDIFTIRRNANDTEIKGKTYGDMDRLDALVEAEYLGLSKESIANTPEFQKMSESEKKRALAEEKIRTGSLRGLDNTASIVNSLVKQFTDKLGENITIDQIPESELSKAGSVGGYLRLAKKFNEQVRQINADTGRTFSEINVVDGASPTELMKLEWFGENGETLSKELKPTVQQNDNAIQLENIRTQRALGWANLNWDKDKFKLQTQGSEEVKNGATLFAERMYNELKALADPNGVIPPDKLRRLTTEQRKYLGYDKEEIDKESGKVTKGLRPLEITPQDETGEKEGVDAIQLINGEIRVLKDAKKVAGSDSWEGLWDQTRSTTVSNIATNRLNEQLSKAGSKELNSYLPLDKGNIEVESTTSGGGTTVSGSSSTGGGLSMKPTDWTKEGQNWRYKDGTLYDSKGNVIK